MDLGIIGKACIGFIFGLIFIYVMITVIRYCIVRGKRVHVSNIETFCTNLRETYIRYRHYRFKSFTLNYDSTLTIIVRRPGDATNYYINENGLPVLDKKILAMSYWDLGPAYHVYNDIKYKEDLQ